MKHVTDQRKRKRWLAPLALCLAVCLAIHPVGLVVQAEENVEENAVSAFWAAADMFWGEDGKQTAFWKASDALWGNEEEGITGVIDEYYQAMENDGDIDGARKNVQDTIAAYKDAYAEVKPAFDEVMAKFNALSDEEKDEVVLWVYDEIYKIYNGDGTEDYVSIEVIYQDTCIEVEKWNYWDNEFQYQNACAAFGSASEVLYGNEEKGITGAIPAYYEAVQNNGDIDAARKVVLEAAGGVEAAYALIEKSYAAMDESYGKIPDDAKSDLQDSYTGATESKQVFNGYYEETLRNVCILKYINSSDEYWMARDLFWESTNNFLGNEEENIAGAHPAYMAALESEAEELDALYQEALAARAAVEEAYETMTIKYNAENEAYDALTEDDQQAPYGDTTAADIHMGNVNDYTTGWVPETYNLIHECEIPAPPRKEEPEPPTPPSDENNKPGTSGTGNSPASATDYYGNSMRSMEQTIAAAEKGSTVKIVTTESVTLTSSVMRALINNPTVSMYLEYTYNGQNYKVLIPAGKAKVVEGIEYYGPLYLYSLFPYDGRETNANTMEYAIAKGDTLTKIARKYNTTVSELVKLNKILNPNRIRAGQKIVLPAK